MTCRAHALRLLAQMMGQISSPQQSLKLEHVVSHLHRGGTKEYCKCTGTNSKWINSAKVRHGCQRWRAWHPLMPWGKQINPGGGEMECVELQFPICNAGIFLDRVTL